MKIYCCCCKIKDEVIKTNGAMIYSNRPDLKDKVFYKCNGCGNYVGTHAGTEEPLGSIPTPELRKLRQEIHTLLDPLWKEGKIARKKLYSELSFKLGVPEFHTAQINNIATAKLVLTEIKKYY